MATGTETTRDAETEIANAVCLKTAGAVEDLQVEIREDDVRISGTSSSYYIKQLATQAALSASAGRAVRNEILVRGH